MKKFNHKWLGIVAAVALSAITLAACGGEEEEGGAMIGGAYDNDEAQMSIYFYDDGTCEVSDLENLVYATYTLDGSDLTIETDEDIEFGTYFSEDDTIVMDDLDGEFYYVEEAYYVP